MEIRPAKLAGAFTLEPAPFVDGRGFFVRTMSWDVLERAGLRHADFVQESQSRSRARVLRGLHGRRHLSEAKLVRCAHGDIWDVIVDLRPWSPTFLQWQGFVLDDVRHHQLYVPAGFAHGFQVLSHEADVCYRMDSPHDPSLDLSLAWDDLELAIPWPVPHPLVSERDRQSPTLAELRPHLEEWFGSEPPPAS